MHRNPSNLVDVVAVILIFGGVWLMYQQVYAQTVSGKVPLNLEIADHEDSQLTLLLLDSIEYLFGPLQGVFLDGVRTSVRLSACKFKDPNASRFRKGDHRFALTSGSID